MRDSEKRVWWCEFIEEEEEEGGKLLERRILCELERVNGGTSYTTNYKRNSL